MRWKRYQHTMWWRIIRRFSEGRLRYSLTSLKHIGIKYCDRTHMLGRTYLARVPNPSIPFMWSIAFFVSACFPITDMISRFPQSLDDAYFRLVARSKIIGQAIRRLLLIETGNAVQLPQRSLLRFCLWSLVPLMCPRFVQHTSNEPQNYGSSPLERMAMVTYRAVARHMLPYVRLSLGYVLIQLSIVSLSSFTN